MLASTAVVSGFGQLHTNEADPKNPERKQRPYGAIFWDAIKALVDCPKQVDKSEAQWIIPSTLPSRKAKEQEAKGQYWLLWADIDHEPPPVSELGMLVDVITCGAQFEVYTSRSATEERQKARILIPLAQPLNGREWKAAQAVLNDELRFCRLTPDAANEGAAQLCYLPNRGAFYATDSHRTGPFFQPLEKWAREIAEKYRKAEEKAAEIEARRKAAAERRASLDDDALGGGLIQAFNQAYEVEDVLLRAGYDQDGDRFRHPGSMSGSYSACVQDGRVHSLSSADPLYTGGHGGGAHDAFGAFSVLFAGGSREEALRTAGDQWLTIGGESWNAAKRREYARQEGSSDPLAGFYVLPGYEEAGGRFKLLTAGELALLPPVRWRIKGVLPESGIAALYGLPGTGKSFLALDMLAHVAEGRQWFGCATTPCPVVYIGLEGEAGIGQRIQAWQRENGELPDTFRAILSGLDIRKDGDRAALVDAIRETGMSGGVLVVDTLNQATPGMDENDSAGMGLAIAGLKHLQRELGGVVLLIHHSGKDVTKGLRGHSSLIAALDASIEVSRSGEARTWRIGKAKDGGDGIGQAFRLENVSLGLDAELAEVTSCVVKPEPGGLGTPVEPKAKIPSGKSQKIALGVLTKMFEEQAATISPDALSVPRVGFEMAIEAVCKKLPIVDTRKKYQAKRSIDGLVSGGWLVREGDYLMQC